MALSGWRSVLQSDQDRHECTEQKDCDAPTEEEKEAQYKSGKSPNWKIPPVIANIELNITDFDPVLTKVRDRLEMDRSEVSATPEKPAGKPALKSASPFLLCFLEI